MTTPEPDPQRPAKPQPSTPNQPSGPQGIPNQPTAQPPLPAQPPLAPQKPLVPNAVPAVQPQRAAPPAAPPAVNQPLVPGQPVVPNRPVMPNRPLPAQKPNAPPLVQNPSPPRPNQPRKSVVATAKPLQPSKPKSANKSRPISVEKPSAVVSSEEGEQQEEVAKKIVRTVPPWLASTVVHMLGLIVLALLTRSFVTEKPLRIEVVEYGEELGEQLIDDSLELQADLPDIVSYELLSVDELEVVDPLASMDVNVVLDSLEQVEMVDVTSIGHALAGREPGARRALLGKYGGTATTEAAVLRGLQWLKRNQLRDGSWSLLGPFKGFSANTENKTSATAMALLAFLGAGHTHQSGEFRTVVTRGAKALLGLQSRDGDFQKGDNPHWTLYAHAQATIALCELYGMTKDEKFREPAQRAIDYCASIQSQEGGWKYTPGSGADMSVTGWYVMALQSAKMAELKVAQQTLDNISGFIDSVAHQGGARYAYMPIGYEPTLAMTAEALLCRQYLGWSRDDPRLLDGVEYINQNRIPTGDDQWRDEKDVYYWYYATQVMHHMGGEHWQRWNDVMRQQIPSRQVMKGSELGSWDNDYDTSGVKAGRLYTTCLCIYMLEVYYRHLPIYQYRGK